MGKGTAEAPITLTVQEKGKVTLRTVPSAIYRRAPGSGGLVFKNGYTPTSEVISFRKDKETLQKPLPGDGMRDRQLQQSGAI